MRAYLVAIGLAVIPLSLFIEGAHRLLIRETTKRVVADSSRVGKQLARAVSRRFADDSNFLQAFAQRPDVMESWHRADSDLTQSLERAHKLHPDFAAIGLYDLQGGLKAASPPNAVLLGRKYGFRDLRAGVAAGESYVSAAYESAGASGYSVAIAVPMRDSAGALRGIAVAQQSLDSIARDIYGFLTPVNSGLVFIADPANQVFGETDGKIVAAPAIDAVMKKLSRVQTDQGQHFTLGSGEVIAAYSPVNAAGWGILVNVPLETIRVDLWKGEKTFGLFGGLVLLLAIAGGGFVAAAFQRFRRREREYQEEIEMRNEELAARTSQLAHANRDLDSFSYSVSHDLRAPIRHINGFSRILLEDASEALTPEQRGMLDQVCASAAHMGEMVDGLLQLSRLGHQTLNVRPQDMNALVREVVAEAERDTAGRAVEWKLHPLPETVCDLLLMRQVFRNLVGNAVKFTSGKEKAAIEIGHQIERGEPAFYVRDNGAGFDMKYGEKLFLVFQRLHSQEQFEGSGVGLAIVHRIITRHSGRIWAESQPGQGTTFFFTLPAPKNIINEKPDAAQQDSATLQSATPIRG